MTSLLRDHTAVVDGIPMRWTDYGDGDPVVFVHGIPTSPLLWRHVLPRVAGVRCLAWEMVGYGNSIPSGRNREISVASQAEYLAACLSELGLDRAVVVGPDLGGGVAQILAVEHPDRVAGLVLINSIGYDSCRAAPAEADDRLIVGVRTVPLRCRTIAGVLAR